jgi:hypothetical protein
MVLYEIYREISLSGEIYFWPLVFSGYSCFLPQYNWPQRYNCNIVESGVKHHNSTVPYPSKVNTFITRKWLKDIPVFESDLCIVVFQLIKGHNCRIIFASQGLRFGPPFSPNRNPWLAKMLQNRTISEVFLQC